MPNGQHEPASNPAWLVPAIMGAASVVTAWFRSMTSGQAPPPKQGGCLEALARITSLEEHRAIENERHAARREWEKGMDLRLVGIEGQILQVAIGRGPSETPK